MTNFRPKHWLQIVDCLHCNTIKYIELLFTCRLPVPLFFGSPCTIIFQNQFEFSICTYFSFSRTLLNVYQTLKTELRALPEAFLHNFFSFLLFFCRAELFFMKKNHHHQRNKIKILFFLKYS